MTEFLPVSTMDESPLNLSVRTMLQEHPGGPNMILRYAGRDATAAYEPIHPPDALDKHLPPEKHLGDLDHAGSATLRHAHHHRRKTKDEVRVENAQARKPSVDRTLSLRDIEAS